ncbi:hypothetical protein S83_022430 [Arachis hypogaea]
MLPDLNEPLLPDLNQPLEPPEEPYQPIFPLVGSLSGEDQRAVDRLISLENLLVVKATHMLRSLHYTPIDSDVKFVLSAFLVDYPSSDAYQSLLPHFLPMEPPSPIFLQF